MKSVLFALLLIFLVQQANTLRGFRNLNTHLDDSDSGDSGSGNSESGSGDDSGKESENDSGSNEDDDSDSGSENGSDSGSESDSNSNGGANCKDRQVFVGGKCVTVIDQCKTWNPTTGACLTCNDGFSFANGKCTSLCKDRQVFVGGKCVTVSDNCKTWSNTNGDCLSCNVGCTLSAGKCTVGGGNNGTCYFREVFVGGKCINVSDQCQTWSNVNGDCLSCYVGYTLSAGKCTVGGGNNGNNGTCYFRQVFVCGKCINVSDQCQTWSNVNGDCLSCYGGYTLSAGKCIVGTPNNGNRGFNNGGCYFRQVFVGGKCVNVRDQCQTWSSTTGDCTSCYGGYTLSSGKCRL